METEYYAYVSGNMESVHCVAIRPDTEWGDAVGSLEPLFEFNVPANPSSVVEVARDGDADFRRLAVGNGAGELRIFRVDAAAQEGTQLTQLDAGGSKILALNCIPPTTPGGFSRIVTGDSDSHLWIHNIHSGEHTELLECPSKISCILAGECVRHAQNHVYVAGRDPAAIVKYDLETGTKLGEFTGHNLSVGALGIDVGRKLLFSGSPKGTNVKVWSTDSFQKVSQRDTSFGITAMTTDTKSVDKCYLCLGREDGHAMIFDVRNMDKLHRFYKLGRRAIRGIKQLDLDNYMTVSDDCQACILSRRENVADKKTLPGALRGLCVMSMSESPVVRAVPAENPDDDW